MLLKGPTNFLKICRPQPNPSRHKGDIKQFQTEGTQFCSDRWTSHFYRRSLLGARAPIHICIHARRKQNTFHNYAENMWRHRKEFSRPGHQVPGICSPYAETKKKNLLMSLTNTTSRSQWSRGVRRRSPADHLLRLRVRIPPGAWRSVCCECCGLSGRGLCVGLIARPEESYRL